MIKKTKPENIDFSSSTDQYIGDLSDRRSTYLDDDPGKEFAIPKPVVFNHIAADHLSSDQYHSRRIEWIQQNTKDFVRAIESPDIIECAIRSRANDLFSVTHIVRTQHVSAEGWDYMVVAIGLDGKANKGNHLIITIHGVKEKRLFRSNGVLREKYIYSK